DADSPGARRCEIEEARVDELVVDDEVGPGQTFGSPQRHQARIARPGADEVNQWGRGVSHGQFRRQSFGFPGLEDSTGALMRRRSGAQNEMILSPGGASQQSPG